MQKPVESPAATAPPRMHAADWALMALHSMLWGSAFFFIAIARTEISALTFTALRLVPASLILLAVAHALGLRLPGSLSVWGSFILLGALNNTIPFLLIIYGQSEVTGGIAAVFNATAPLFAVVLAHFLTTDERFSARRFAGVLIGIAGVALLVARPGASLGDGIGPKLALLAAALCYALAGLWGRRTLAGTPPVMVALMQMLGAFLVVLPFTLIVDRPWLQPMPSPRALGAMLATGVLASAFASLCYFTLIKRAGATNALLVTIIMPLTPMLLGWAFLGERLTARDALGAATIALALLVIDGRALAALLRWRPA